jgi:hypothetical protein
MFSLVFAQASQNWFVPLPPGEVVALVALGGATLVAVTAIIAHHWHKVRVAEMNAALKQQMLDKGVPVADIERILQAGLPPVESPATPATDDTPQDVPALVKYLAECEQSGEDIERILRAVAADPIGVDVQGPESARTAHREKIAMVKHLIECEKDAEEIERVLRACRAGATNGVGST